MYKNFLLIIMLFFCSFFIMNFNYVEAYNGDVVYKLDGDLSPECEFLFGDPNDEESVAHFLQDIFNIFKYAAPILCLALSIVDFVKAVGSQDKDALLKAGKNAGKRIILALILFFIPTLINFLFPLLGWYGTCSIG